MSNAKQVPTLDKRPPPSTVEDEEELDDILDEFSSTPSQTQPPLESPLEPSFSGRPRTNTRVDEPPKSIPGTTKTGPTLGSTLEEGESPDEDALTQAFAAELQKEMENLMRELGDQAGGVDGNAEDMMEGLSEEERQRKSLQAVWEKLLIDGLNDPGSLVGEPMEGTKKGAGAGAASAGPSGSTGSAFQDKIKEAMNKIAEGEGKVKSEGPAPSPESLEELLKSLGDLGLGGNGADPDETELASFLDNMMGQLMSKEVLYEPLKELSEGFPKYLANPPEPLSSDDKGKYEKQYELTKKILAVFDAPDYSDGDSKRAEQIVELMSEMQALGTPPKEIMGELPAGLDFGGEGCVVA